MIKFCTILGLYVVVFVINLFCIGILDYLDLKDGETTYALAMIDSFVITVLVYIIYHLTYL